MSRFFDISLPEIRKVWYNVGISRVDVKISARPNGIMSGIHPAMYLMSKQRRQQNTSTHTPCVFHSPASFVHLVLLGDTTAHKVHIARAVPFHFQGARLEGPLFPDKDMEIVVGGVQTRVALGAKWRPEDDEVLCDAGVDNIHGAHGATCVAEHPLGAVGVYGDARGRVGRCEVREDVRYHAGCVVG